MYSKVLDNTKEYSKGQVDNALINYCQDFKFGIMTYIMPSYTGSLYVSLPNVQYVNQMPLIIGESCVNITNNSRYGHIGGFTQNKYYRIDVDSGMITAYEGQTVTVLYMYKAS